MSADATSPVILNGQPLTLDEVAAVARRHRQVGVGAQGRQRIDAARAVVARLGGAGDQAIYGVNTGFGSLARVRISANEVQEVQRNLLRSHAAGIGEPLAVESVRAMMLILAASLCRGFSGVRAEIVEAIVTLLNQRVTPLVPSRGSVGASGDLAPLAHAALLLIGEGHAQLGGDSGIHDGARALAAAGIKPLVLQAKEGLALVNGTHLMTALGALALCDVQQLRDAALCAAALAIDACRATDAFLDERLHAARNQPGQRDVAAGLRRLLQGSTILASHKSGDPRVQDPYSLRAIPQVLGAAFDAIGYARGIFENELGAVTDNPLVFAARPATDGSAPSQGGAIVSGGNFHGMPLAIALDTLKIALCHIAGIAERRIFWVLSGSDSENPVNMHLSPQPGLHSGMMIVQYAAAACCNELQTLTAPASVANIPTCAGIEDYNSMGATSALQARTAVELAVNVIAAELLVMCEALEYQRPLRSGRGVERVHEQVRAVVPRLTHDRPPAPDIAAIATLIKAGTFAI